MRTVVYANLRTTNFYTDKCALSNFGTRRMESKSLEVHLYYSDNEYANF